MANTALYNGSVLKHGEYRIVRVLGQGGFGITYEAEQTSLRRRVVVKEFFMKDVCNRDGRTGHVSVPSVGSRDLVAMFRAKFIREARLIASLNNPHIVQVYDVFEEHGTAYYVMEYLRGGSLLDVVNRRGALPVAEALRYIRGVASALSSLHQRNTLHLDVKPSNVMLNEEGEAVLIDFGISKRIDSGGHLTSSTPMCVSRGYAPFEQLAHDDESTFSPATDIYALGATLYYLLTARTPRDASELLRSFPTDDLDTHRVPPCLISAIRQCMRVAKEDRPQSVEAFLGLLDKDAPDSRTDEQTVKIVATDEERTKLAAHEQPAKIETASAEVQPQADWKTPLWMRVVLTMVMLGCASYLLYGVLELRVNAFTLIPMVAIVSYLFLGKDITGIFFKK